MKTSRRLNPLAFFPTCKARVPVFFKNLVTLFLFSILLFSSNTFAQVGPGTAPVNPPPGGFGIEGDLKANTPTTNIGDWLPGSGGSGGNVLDAAGNPLSGSTFHLIDRYTSPDNNFKGGFKVNGNPNAWLWVTNPVNDKEDMNNALIHFTHSPDGHLWVIIAADRKSNNGDAYIDFEFLQNTMSLTGGPAGGGFTSSGPDGGRTVNDFLLTLELTNGGSTATFFVNRWESDGGSGFNYVDKTSLTPAGSVYAAVNAADGTPVSYGAFGKTTYDKNTFVEAAVDLTALLGAIDNCTELGINTIFIKTKESQSPTATIVDFIAPLQGSITIGVADAGQDQSMCSTTGSATFTVTGTATPSPTDAVASTTWSVVPGSGTAVITDATALTTSVDVSSASVKLAFNVKTVKGCDLTDTIVLSLTSAPTIFTLTPVSFCDGDPAKGSCILNNSAPSVSYQLYNSSNTTVDVPQTGTGGQLSWTGLDPDTYYVVASASGGCSSNTDDATVNKNEVPTGEPTAADASKCGPGDVLLNADCSASSIPTTPTWYDAATLGNLLFTGNNFTVSPTGDTSFWVSCTSDQGCESPRTQVDITVNQPPAPPTVDASGATQCAQDPVQTITASATASGGASVVWYDAATNGNIVDPPTLNTVSSVTYYAEAVSGEGADACASTTRSPATLTINATPAAPTVTAVDNCDGTSTLTVTGIVQGATITWSDDASNHDNPRTVTVAGTYKATQSLGDCTSGEGSANAAPKTTPATPTVTPVDNCDGTSTLTVTGLVDGATLNWSDDATNHDNPRTVSVAGTYKVTQTLGDCTSGEGSANAAPKTTPATPTVTPVDNCDGTSTLTVTGLVDGAILTWSDDASNHDNPRTVTVAGTYKVTQSLGDCTSGEGSANAAPKTAPAAPSVGVVNNCNGTSTLTVTGLVGGATLNWSDDATNHSNPRTVTVAGTYKASQTLNGCTSGEGSANAAPKTAPASPSVGVVNNCNGTSTLTVTGLVGGATLNWSDDATNHSNPRTVTVAGTYKASQTLNGCTSGEGSATAAPKTTPAAPSASGTTVCAPNSAVASASGCSGILTWYDAATGGSVVATGVNSVTTATTKTYYVSCTVNGCESSRTPVTATVNICTGIYPTATSCTGFNSGTIQFLPKVCVATKTRQGVTSVTNATPGVFFYYTKITAPATTFSVYIDQTQCSNLNRNFAIQKAQVLAFTNGCSKIATGAQAATAGDGVITIKNVHIGDIIVISVKYDVKSMVGATVTGGLPLNCTDNFVARLGTTNAGSIIANTSTSILVTSNCSASAFTASSSIAKTDINKTQSLQVKAYPNPYTNVVNFSIVSPVSGKAVLEAYNMLGQRVAIIFEGNVDAGVQHNFKYNVPAGNRVPLMYKLTVGGQTFHGTLIPAR